MNYGIDYVNIEYIFNELWDIFFDELWDILKYFV